VMGLASTVVVARLLLPADYGIVAMSMLVVGLIQAMLDFGAATALLRKGGVTPAEINSAWTLRLLEGCVVGLILIAAASPSAHYFREPRVEMVLWVLAACIAINSASNIGFTLAQKEFNFSLEFRHNLICKSMGVIATITAAYVLGDYRALVIGVATGYTSGCLMSYVMHPYRPSWDTSKISDIWAVTKWLMLAGVGGFILRKSDELIAARIGTTGEYGQYNVGPCCGRFCRSCPRSRTT
jgi:lipopolysaccharide exporter